MLVNRLLCGYHAASNIFQNEEPSCFQYNLGDREKDTILCNTVELLHFH